MFNTYLLDREKKKQRQANEEKRREMISKVFAVLEDIAPKYGIERAYLFGSISRQFQFVEDSDIDIALENLPEEYYFKLLAELSRRLGYDVDLVNLEKCRFSEYIKMRGIQWKS